MQGVSFSKSCRGFWVDRERDHIVLGLCVKVRPGAVYLARQVVQEAQQCALKLIIPLVRSQEAFGPQVWKPPSVILSPLRFFWDPSWLSSGPTALGWPLWSSFVSHPPA